MRLRKPFACFVVLRFKLAYTNSLHPNNLLRPTTSVYGDILDSIFHLFVLQPDLAFLENTIGTFTSLHLSISLGSGVVPKCSPFKTTRAYLLLTYCSPYLAPSKTAYGRPILQSIRFGCRIPNWPKATVTVEGAGAKIRLLLM